MIIHHIHLPGSLNWLITHKNPGLLWCQSIASFACTVVSLQGHYAWGREKGVRKEERIEKGKGCQGEGQVHSGEKERGGMARRKEKVVVVDHLSSALWVAPTF